MQILLLSRLAYEMALRNADALVQDTPDEGAGGGMHAAERSGAAPPGTRGPQFIALPVTWR